MEDDSWIRSVRERSGPMERAGELDSDLIEAIYEEKLFKLFVPESMNGAMTPLPEALRAFERAAWIDGAFGWAVTIGAGGGFFAATMDQERARELFSAREAVIAGSGLPTGRAVRAEGGYRVSGRWSYCSGALYASFFTANCVVVAAEAGEAGADRVGGADGAGGAGAERDDGAGRAGGAWAERDDGAGRAGGAWADRVGEADGAGGADAGRPPLVRSFAFLPWQVEVIRDWNAFGLRATGSHTIVVNDAFVPDDMTFDIMEPPRLADPIYRYPFLPFAQTSFAAVVLGIGRHFLDECAGFADERKADWEAVKPRKLELLLSSLAEWRREVDAAADRFHAAATETWAGFLRAGALSPEAERLVGRRSREAARTAVRAAEALFPQLGMTALRQDHPLNRTWRDLHTAAQHSVLQPDGDEENI
ncbi:acyl-CoA dehydrogenase [Cohnella massiliensis]|uniref:acyl-CoA dehydrogenase n=1 Tax=Cohnella massiliensis TaxID=1816691 RepID=UPI0015940399|nr:acyl-CoA dehydrogenase [Cohnella massiliensis]